MDQRKRRQGTQTRDIGVREERRNRLAQRGVDGCGCQGDWGSGW